MTCISPLKRNYFLLITTVLFSFFLASANAQTWTTQVIGGATTADKCAATCMDVSGNVYVAGTINSGTSTFGSSTFTSAGLFDGIVLKYNSTGVLQWGYRFGSTLNDNALAIATDGTNVYVAGTYTGSITIGSSSLTSAGSADGVVMSLNASTGAANWGTSFGGTSVENVYGLTLDPSSNVYITGNFFSAPAAFGSFSLTPSSSTSDMFVAKLNSSGIFQWASNGGGTGNDNPVGAGISYVPALSEIVVVGGVNGGGTCTYGSVSFAASTGAGNDIILLEVNASTGAFISGMAAGGAGSSNEDALAACYDAFTGNVMLSGYFNSPSFTMGSTTLTNSTAAGAVDDMFYASYNPTTNVFAWAKSAGGSGTGSDRARGICSNGTGGIILGGIVSGNATCTFPSALTIQITNARTNGGDPFLAQVSASTGSAIWAKIGAADPATTTDNAINAVTCSSSGTIWGAGLATTNLTFSPLTALTSTGGVDIYAVKLIAPPPLSATQSQVNLTCNGVCTGSSTVVASGGTSPYTYSWSPSGGSGATASSLCATNYTVTITDAVSASITKTFNITQPPAIIITPVSQTNVSCFGGSNGAAQITASGGTGTLTYNWTPGNPPGDGTGSVTSLTAQNYTITVTDANSCTATRTFNITQPAAPVSGTKVITNISCFGGSNGTINLTPTGGTGPYTFNWLPSGPTTEDRTGLTAGTYSVQITDGNGCTGTVTATVTQPTAPVSGTTVVTNIACFSGATGAINLTPTGGTGPYTFNWLPSGPTTEDRTGLTAGTYSVQITDANGCTGTITPTVTQPTAPVSGTTVVTNVSCFGGSNGTINLTPTGGTGPYTFNWLPSGPTTEDRTGLTAGTYSVQITDGNGCTGTVTATVTQPTAPVSGTTVVTNVSCFGGSNGTINLTPTGGTGPYTFNWLPLGPTTEDRTGLTAGTYSVQITDGNGCTGTVTAAVTQPTAPVSGTTVVTNVSCFGGSNGTINLTPTGGTGPYTFNWLPSGPTTEDRTGLTAGTYSVQITDGNGCTGTVTATVTQPTAPVSGTTVVTNVSCFGGSNGTINLTPTGGTGPYTFNWLPSGPTTEDRTGLTAGTYSVQITDGNGCTGTVTATVTQPTAPVSGTTVVTNIACFSGATGAINLTPTGGTGPYTFNWLPSGPTTEDRTGLTAGTYSVQITDGNGCTGTVTATVTQPTAPVSGTTVVTNVSCFGGSNGTINLTPTGGTSPYTFNWLPSGPTTEDRTGLTAGTYSVQITDGNGCTGTVTATVTQPTAPVSGTTVVTNVSCFGGSNGTINLTPTGGTGPYTFNWLPSGPTTEDRTGLTAGTYSVQITDANGCTGTITPTVTQPTAPVSGTTVVTNVSCFGGSNGTINLTPTGGTGPYTFNWLPSGPTTEDRTGLTAGTYSVQITDGNGCTGTITPTITQPTAPVSGTTVVTNVACFSGATGAINLTPTGGTSPYTFNWLPSGPTTEDRTGLTAGTYSVQITDANGCTGTITPTVTQPTAPVSGTSVVTNVSCFGGSNGTINLTPTGGTGPYTFNWLPSGPTTEDRTGLTAGTYSVQITDGNGCTGTVTATVTQPTAPVSGTTVVTNVSCFGGSNGTINLTPTGGTGPYTFNWLPSGPTTEDRTGLTAGTYSVQITDGNGCTGTVTATVTQPTAPVSGTTVVTNVSCFGGSNGTINLTPTGGTGPYTFNWLPSGPTTEDRTGLTAGTYSVQITDGNGCTGTVTATVTQPTAPVSGTTVVTNVSCFGGSNGTINLTPTGGTGPYTFNWLPLGPTTEDRTGLTAGTYSVQITDGNGCTGTVTAAVTQPTAPVSGTTVVTNVSCFGGSNGTINLTPTGGTSPYTFNWLPSGPTTEDRTGLTAGTYSVQITDANGCTGTITPTVTQPTAPVSGTSVVTNVSCFGGSNGTINLTPTGGTGPYTFNWLPSGPTTEDRTGLTAGTYSVQITDGNGCTGTVTATVTQPTAPVSGTTVVTNVSCFGGSNGTINLTPTGGTSPYTFNWLPSGPTTEDRTGLTAGTYSVQITDGNGCTGNVTATVTQPTAPVSGTTVITNTSCFGGTNGTIDLTPAGGTPGYTFNWGSGITTEDRTGLAAGTYTVIITDLNGCTKTINPTVTSPTLLTAASSATSILCNGGNATVTVTGAGGTTPYTGTGTFTVTAGTYTYTVTDKNNCTATTTITVSEPTVLTAASSASSILCNGGNAVITVTGAGGTTPYTGTGTFTVTAGTYTYTVTDKNNCTATTTITVSEPTVLTATSSATSILCNGGNATVTVTSAGGTPPYTGTGTFTVTAGTYTYTVTDKNSCTATTTITVSEPTVLTAASSASSILCNGGNATVTVTSAGGTTPYTGTGTFTVTAGTYTYTVTDKNSCTATTTITVSEPTVLTAASSASSILCNGGNATVTVTGAGGTTPYTGTGTFTVTAGTYTYTVTDKNNCTATTTITVSEPTVLTATSSASSILCNGGNATVTVTGAGGTTPYTGTGTFTVTAGTYTYTVTDKNNCTATTTITVSEPTVLTAASSATFILCNGGNATVTVTGAGGTAPYTGTGTFTVTAGTYTYTVTDKNSCTATTTITVSEPTVLTAASSASSILCNGGNAVITVTGAGGTTPYTGTGTFTVTAGTYTYTVTDKNNCTATTTITVSEPTVLTATSSATSILCNGGNATVTVTSAGGTPPYTGTGTFTVTAGTYTYTVTDKNSCTATTTITVSEPTVLTAASSASSILCNGGNATVTVTSAGGTTPYTGTGTFTVTAGTYTYTVTDKNNCTATTTITVSEPTVLTAASSATSILCNGGNAVITVTGAGGTTPYTGTGTFTVTAGTYTYTVTDKNSCTATTTITVSEPTVLTAASSATSILCNGGNATVTVTSAGGTTPYTGTGTFTVTAGTYTYTVTDNNGCTATTTITVSEPIVLTATSSATSILCNGGNATVTVTGAGGTTPYTGTGTFTVTAGTYTYTVTDKNNCTVTTTITVSEPTVLTAASSASSILCNGGNAVITVTGAGGTTPYTGTGTFTVTAGTYTYTVTDKNNCTATTTITVSEPIVLTATSSATSILCNGGNATVTITGAGGTAPYTGTGTFTVTAGTYTYTVTDNNGCTATTNILVSEPEKITSSTSFVNSNCGKANGSVSVIASGGTGILHYLWAPTGGSTSTATGLLAGSYTVTITDDNNCVITDVTSISDIGAPIVTSTHIDVSCNGLANGSIDNTVSGGAGSYTYSWSNSAVTEDLTSIPAGVYSYTVTDGAGCPTSGSVTVTEPAAIDVSTTVNGNTIHANAGGAIYQWIDCNNSNMVIAGETNQSFTSTTSGNYAVIITVLGCADTSSCTAIIVTGINSHPLDNTFSFYPNPSSKMITVQVSTEMLQKTKAIYILNALGELLYTQAIISEETHISLESLSEGVYLIQLETASGMLFKKMVKQ